MNFEDKLYNFFDSIIMNHHYDYLIPIEKKGIVLVETYMKNNFDKLKNIKIKPLNVHNNNEMRFEDGAKILLFDDTSYTGDTFIKAINKIDGNNLIIHKAAYVIRSDGEKFVDYYGESIDESQWFSDKRPLELKYLKIESIPYNNLYPTIKLTISNKISKQNILQIMKKIGFSKFSKITPKNLTMYEKSIKRTPKCNIINSTSYYEIVIYIIKTNLYISFINDNDNELNTTCINKTRSEFSDLDCFDCEYVEFINTYFNQLHSQLQSELLTYKIKIVDQSSNFNSILDRHKEKDLVPINFLLKVLFK